MASDLHPSLSPLAVLLGNWTGSGHGEYPTIEPFDYEESATFSHVGKPFISYTQSTRHAGTGQPLHSETGYWRMAGPTDVELVVAQPTGIVDVASGSIVDSTIRLRSISIASTPTAKEVFEIEREVHVDGDRLRYSLKMAAAGQPLTLHLTGDLRRSR